MNWGCILSISNHGVERGSAKCTSKAYSALEMANQFEREARNSPGFEISYYPQHPLRLWMHMYAVVIQLAQSKFRVGIRQRRSGK